MDVWIYDGFMGRAETFSIRQVIELTGLSEFTIRGWESRYEAFEPRRTPTGRREYSRSDVDRALLLRELLKRGHRIGKIAKLGNKQLRELFHGAGAAAESVIRPSSAIVDQAMELLALQRWVELDEFVRERQSADASALVREFLLPCLRALGDGVSRGLITIAQEHVFSSLLKEKIYSALSGLRPAGSAKARFVMAAPEGDHHEIGLLMAHLLVRARGMASLFVGPHTPARELAETALRFDASHLLVVSTVSRKGGARQDVLSFVSELRGKIGGRAEILLAGNQAPVSETPGRGGLRVLGSFEDLEGFLTKLGNKR